MEENKEIEMIGKIKLKTKSQIQIAQETIKGLQDYVELARCQKKLRLYDDVEYVDKQIAKLVEVVKKNVEEL